MQLLLDSFWRAVAYCLHPRVIALSIVPVLVMVASSFALGYFFWSPAVAGVTLWLDQWDLFHSVLGWLDRVGIGEFRSVVAPLIVLAVSTPVIVVVALLLVGVFMTPAMVELVAQRRFAHVERRRGASAWRSALWALWSTLLALLALAMSLPLWLLPPLALVLPP